MSGPDETIRELAERMARELDVHADRAEAAVRNLIRLGLIELAAPPAHMPGLIDWSQVSTEPHPAARFPSRDDALEIDWTRIKGEISRNG